MLYPQLTLAVPKNINKLHQKYTLLLYNFTIQKKLLTCIMQKYIKIEQT